MSALSTTGLIVPTVSRSPVYHVGKFQVPSVRPFSHEGPCLSISPCPDAWRRIARLGDAPTWALTHPQGCFLDVHATQRTPGLMEGIYQWGDDAGLVKAATLYQVTDPDGGEFLFDNLDEAQAEAESHDLPCLHERPGWVATEGLTACLNQPVPLVFVSDFLLIAFVDSTCMTLHGLWWRDRLAPAMYSAPRGGILPRSLPEWSRYMAS